MSGEGNQILREVVRESTSGGVCSTGHAAGVHCRESDTGAAGFNNPTNTWTAGACGAESAFTKCCILWVGQAGDTGFVPGQQSWVGCWADIAANTCGQERQFPNSMAAKAKATMNELEIVRTRPYCMKTAMDYATLVRSLVLDSMRPDGIRRV